MRRVSRILKIKETDKKLAEKIMEECGLSAMDSLHIAIATENADVFITVDDGVLNTAECLK